MDKAELIKAVSDVRQGWDAVIGADWAGGTARIFRLASEVPSVSNPERVWQRLADQVSHQRKHLRTVKEWMSV